MTFLFSQIISWRALVVAMVVLGFAPGAALRIIVLAFERSDPRRRELLAELYAVPWLERPLWVAEQAEVALAEGMGGRLAKGYRRLAPVKRAARWWHGEKDDFLHMRCTVGYQLVTCSYVTILIELLFLVHGTGKWSAYVAWYLVGLPMAWGHQRDRKRNRQTGQPLHATRLDAVICITAGPAAYGATIYLLIHDLAALASGSTSDGYWTGIFVCLLVLYYPWHVILPALREATENDRQSSPPGQATAGDSQLSGIQSSQSEA
jgi:hypothetical protein